MTSLTIMAHQNCNNMEDPIKLLTEKDKLMVNLIFELADVIYGLMIEHLKSVEPKGIGLKQSTKHNFKDMIQRLKDAKKSVLRFTGDTRMLHENQWEVFANNSDTMAAFIKMLANKTRGNLENAQLAWNMLTSLKGENILEVPDKLPENED